MKLKIAGKSKLGKQSTEPIKVFSTNDRQAPIVNSRDAIKSSNPSNSSGRSNRKDANNNRNASNSRDAINSSHDSKNRDAIKQSRLGPSYYTVIPSFLFYLLSPMLNSSFSLSVMDWYLSSSLRATSTPTLLSSFLISGF